MAPGLQTARYLGLTSVVENSYKYDSLRFSEEYGKRRGANGIRSEFIATHGITNYFVYAHLLGGPPEDRHHVDRSFPMTIFSDGLRISGLAKEDDNGIYRLTDKGYEKLRELEKICDAKSLSA